MFAPLSDPELYRYVPGDAYPDVAGLRARYERISRGPSDPRERWWNWALVLRNGRRPTAIGTVEISLVEASTRALLAYALGRSYWGAGYACEASAAAIAYSRETAAPQSVDAYIDTRNARSIALVERLGFKRIAFLGDADIIDGVASDEYHYRLAMTEAAPGTGGTPL